ncbi:MAG: globin domain-containing protein [Polyangiaceae bacterium]
MVDRNEDVVRRFFAHLFDRYPSTVELFGGRTPNKKHHRMLARALIVFVEHLDHDEWLGEQLDLLGARHVDYGVEDHMYDWVGECLILAFSEAAAELWTQEAEDAWRLAYDTIRRMVLQGTFRRRLELASKRSAEIAGVEPVTLRWDERG